MNQRSRRQHALALWASHASHQVTRKHPSPDPSLIGQFAAETGIPPPDSWLELLTLANGADLSGADYWFTDFTGLTRHSASLPDARWHLARHPDWRERGWIPIASDGCGDFFLLGHPFADGPPDAVMFWDQASAPDPGFEYVIASDLWTFIVGVIELRGGPTNWPFDDNHLLTFDPPMRDVPLQLRPGWE